ncbi:MAG: trigger factor [Clostridiales bacterium]|nr:trigger factor [Clostridiales bacterium]
MKLGNYKGLRIRRPNLTVTEAQVDHVLKKEQRRNAVVYNIDDRPADWGDQAVIDFVLRCEGKAVPNGRRHNYPLLLGSRTFVKGFEEAIVGHNIGEVFEIAVTFPLNYRINSLSGRVGVFRIRLNALRLPEYQALDDDFARDFSEFDTLKEWRSAIREELAERRQISANEKINRELLDQIIADSRIPIDRSLKNDVFESLYEDFLDELEENGMSLETYCRRSRQTPKQIRSRKMEEAVRVIQSESVLHAIIDKEHLMISAEEIYEEMTALAEEEGVDYDTFTQMLDAEGMDTILDQLGLEKAMQFVVEHAVFIEETK